MYGVYSWPYVNHVQKKHLGGLMEMYTPYTHHTYVGLDHDLPYWAED